jgi:hypothetical protein
MLKSEPDLTVQAHNPEQSAPAADIAVGDLVRTGANRFPHYAVIALYEGMAWVRDVQTGAYGLTSLDICRKVQGEA